MTPLRLFVLGVWGGVLLAFALTVLAAFALLPSIALTAELVGGALPRIDLVGMILGILAALLGLRWRQAGRLAPGLSVRGLLPLVGAGFHALSAIWVSPELHSLREAAGGSITGLPAGDPILEDFARLHFTSTSLYLGSVGVVLITALWDVLSTSWALKKNAGD
jgi:hypothetical protein